MKSLIFGPTLFFAALVLVVACVSGRSAFAKERPEDVPLPDSCTLMAMAPADRTVHLERLRMLRRGASAVKMSVDGFTFEVDLAVMPPGDLQGWAENEQKCCSYLKIASQIVEANRRATVRIICPADSKNDVMRGFGLEVSK